VAVKIRLKRMGKIRAPFYRVVVMDSRTKRDGRAIEEIGKYHPTAEPSVIEIDSDRAQHWLSTGAQPTEAAAALLKVTGDWQKFKGLPGAEGTLKVAEARRTKKELYEAAVAAAGGANLDVKDAPARKKAAPAKTAAAAPAETPDERARLWSQAHRAAALEQEARELRVYIAGMEGSLSWRVTAPLRRVKSTTQRLTYLARRARTRLKTDA